MKRVLVGALVACVLLGASACGSDDGSASSPPVDPQRAAAQTWADTVTCPATTGALVAAAPSAPPDASPTEPEIPVEPLGTTREMTPIAAVDAVVRCDLVRAADGSETVGRTVLLDAQPLSWFSHGYAWPDALSTTVGDEAGQVTLRYRDGTVVTIDTRTEGGDTVTSNGKVTCVTDDPGGIDPYFAPQMSTTCVDPGGARFTPTIAPPRDGAPPTGCPTPLSMQEAAASPSAVSTARPGAESTPVPAGDVVVVVTCGDFAGGGVPRRDVVWGDAARNRIQPTATITAAVCKALGCTARSSTRFVGYTSGPPVTTVGWSSPANGPGTGPLASALAGGVANGVIGCRYRPSNTFPAPIETCVPLASPTP